MTPEEVDSIDTAPHGPTVDLMIKEIRRGWARERELLERNNTTLEEKRTAERDRDHWRDKVYARLAPPESK